MPARLVQVTIINNSDYPIVWQDDGREHGFWQEPWYPSNIKNLKKGEQSSFRLESGGIATGVNGWAFFKVAVPFASNVGDRTEFFTLSFERAYIETESFKGGIQYNSPHPGSSLAFVRDVGSGDIANMDSSPFEFIAALPGAPFNAPVFLGNDSIAKHVAWFVEVRNTAASSTLPLKKATRSIIYAITPRVEAVYGSSVSGPASGGHSSIQQTPTSGGDLMWFRHDGRLDGTFNWEGPEKVGNRWDGFKHVFSGGDGIIYGITPRVEAVHSSPVLDSASGSHSNNGQTPASGGELVWFRHHGRQDGTFNWEGPKTVGSGWDGFKHVFSGGNGIIYGIQENGDLMWYRHVGRADGSFVWNGPNKVGIGWGQVTQVFSGEDGIIYAVTPRQGNTKDIPGGSKLASGGDLMWYRHLGREDGSFSWLGPSQVGAGWDGLKHLFSDGDGIIYGVTPRVGGSHLSTVVSSSNLESGDHIAGSFTPASGGDLMWYHHIGVQEGTFKWEGPKKVGSGWGELTQLFSGGALSD